MRFHFSKDSLKVSQYYLAVQQSDFIIAVNGLESLAVIVDQAFYDPEGLRLRG